MGGGVKAGASHLAVMIPEVPRGDVILLEALLELAGAVGREVVHGDGGRTSGGIPATNFKHMTS
jgi:hypothetical protein